MKACATIKGRRVNLRGIYGKFLALLRRATIYKVRVLRDPKNGEILEGYLPTYGEIFLGTWVPKEFYRRPIVRVLIHELCHWQFPELRERDVQLLEELLYKSFSKKQKAVFRSYIPRRYSKKKPK